MTSEFRIGHIVLDTSRFRWAVYGGHVNDVVHRLWAYDPKTNTFPSLYHQETRFVHPSEVVGPRTIRHTIHDPDLEDISRFNDLCTGETQDTALLHGLQVSRSDGPTITLTPGRHLARYTCTLVTSGGDEPCRDTLLSVRQSCPTSPFYVPWIKPRSGCGA